MFIDKTIKNAKSNYLMGVMSHLQADDKKWLNENGYKLERLCRGILFGIKVRG